MTIEYVKRGRGRPKKDQAGFSSTRDALLRAGIVQLTETGFVATGIEAILKHVGVPKGSFYHYFASKDAFGLELVAEYSRFLEHKLDKHFHNLALSPLDRLQSYVDDAADGMHRYDYTRGCLVGNLGQEVQALSKPFRTALSDALKRWQDKLSALLLEAQQFQQIAQDIDCDEAAYTFWAGWEGAVLRARLEKSDRPLISFARFYIRGLK